MTFSGSFQRLAGVVACIFLLVPLTLAQKHPGKSRPEKRVSAARHVVRSPGKKRVVRHVVKRRYYRPRRRVRRVRGQEHISADRAREIQSALIREHYLSGQPSGDWDQKTRDALMKYQADNGWQTKYVPDARALIKLGLGPSHDGLLNPETAAITSPNQLGVQTDIPGGAEAH